jgi:hypothetical protein
MAPVDAPAAAGHVLLRDTLTVLTAGTSRIAVSKRKKSSRRGPRTAGAQYRRRAVFSATSSSSRGSSRRPARSRSCSPTARLDAVTRPLGPKWAGPHHKKQHLPGPARKPHEARHRARIAASRCGDVHVLSSTRSRPRKRLGTPMVLQAGRARRHRGQSAPSP